MIEINLLGGTPPKTPRTPLAIPTRPILYGVLALVVGLAALEYLPGYLEETMAPPPATPSIDDILAEAERLREELVSRQPSPAPEPAPVVPEPEPAPVVPEPVAEATPPPPDPPAPDPIPIANDGLASLLRKSADVVTTFTVLNAAVPPGSHYELLSVGTERFVTELWVPERILLEKYQAGLHRNLPRGKSAIGSVRSNLDASVFRAQIWGTTQGNNGDAPTPSMYDNSATLIQKLRTLARRHHLQLVSATARAALPRDGFQQIPLMVKIRGADGRSLPFLKALSMQRWNIAVQKISVRPTEGREMMQMNLTLAILIPAS